MSPRPPAPGPVLPPGQRAAPWARFGLPRFADRAVLVPARPLLQVRGAVAAPLDLDLTELGLLERREQAGDLHCVTTWSALGLTWSGFRFADLLDLLTERARPDPAARWLVLRGLDGYLCNLHLADARHPSVLLADRVAGRPLTAAAGAPLRVVAPQLYAYKSVRSLVRLEFTAAPRSGSAAWAEHPRGRVALEERSRLLPGWCWRPLWRAVAPPVRRRYAAVRSR